MILTHTPPARENEIISMAVVDVIDDDDDEESMEASIYLHQS